LYVESKSDENVYKKRLWQLCARDTQTMESLQCDTRYESFIGINALRTRVMSILIAAYQNQVPILQQYLTNHAKDLQAEQARVDKELDTLKDKDKLASFLRITASLRCTQFTDIVKELLHGTTEGKPLEFGSTLEEELVDLTERRPDLVSCGVDALLAEASGVNRCSCRLYGGAQLVRALEVFKASTAAAAKGKPVSSQIKSKTTGEACENAQRQARVVLAPLISRLCDASSKAISLIADVADSIIDNRQVDGNKLIGSPDALLRKPGCEGLCMSLLPSLLEYSYLPKSVKAIFLEITQSRIAEFQKNCIADLLAPLSEFSLPALQVPEGDDLSDAIFRQLVSNCSESVSMHFFSTLLQELVVSIPAEIHATIMNMEDAHMANMFKLEALNNALSAEKASLVTQLESTQQKQQDTRTFVL